MSETVALADPATITFSSEPVLATKLYLPPTRLELVPRPRLFEKLDQGLTRRLVLVSAPAGFGKTTLLSTWAQARTSPGPCQAPVADEDRSADATGPSDGPRATAVAWLSLDATDNDLPHFLRYLSAALQTAAGCTGQATLAAHRTPHPAPPEQALTRLINELCSTQTEAGECILVLDDYHRIEAGAVHQAVKFLLDYMPPHLHLAIATRADPPLPLARLRSLGQLVEVRADDLRFRPEEAATFLNQSMGLNLSAEDIAALETRTEGWITGLQMAALSLQGREDTSHFVRAFSGSHRYVLDYLIEEVLGRQHADVQAFLLQTSLLERLSGPLCDAVTGQTGGQEALTTLERANLFIVPLDDERRWYRYHHLFAQLLRARLQATAPDLVFELRARAATWLEEHGLLTEAVSHALAAKDFERVARIAESPGTYGQLERADRRTILNWVEALPDDALSTRPGLYLFQAWAQSLMGRYKEAEAQAHQAEIALDRVALSTSQPSTEARRISALRGEAALVRAHVARVRGEMDQAMRLSHEALASLPEEELHARSIATATLGIVHYTRGDVATAEQLLLEAIGLAEDSTNVNHSWIPVFRAFLAELRLAQGRLTEAEAVIREGVRFIDSHLGQPMLIASAASSIGLGKLAYESNQLLRSAEHLALGIDFAEQTNNVMFLMDGCALLARTRLAQGDAGAARALADRSMELARRHHIAWDVFIPSIQAYHARLWLAEGQLDQAASWAHATERSGPPLEHVCEYEDLTRARVHLAEGRPEGALRLLARWQNMAEQAGRTGSVVEFLALRALALQAQGKEALALVPLAKSLALAEPAGYVRTFVDEGRPMARLLRQAAARGIATGYTSQILAALRAYPGDDGVAGAPPGPGDLVEPLSERELEVLRLVAAGLSNREIAEALVIAIGTVKAHVHNIYGKLGVRTRTQAVAQAREFRLL